MSINVTLTIPETIIRKIDRDRRLVNRSKFVVHLIELAYNSQKERGKVIQ